MKKEKMTTIDMTKMPKRKRGSRKSSSSDKMEVLNQPINILALGSHLTDELGFSETRDTLGRWMAHYVAELIATAANAPDGPTKENAQAIAAKEILAIWSHRYSLPGNAYPLARFKGIIESLGLLAPGGSPWEHPAEGSRAAQAGEVYEQLRQLSLACLYADFLGGHSKLNTLVKAQLDPEESKLFSVLNEWAQSVYEKRNSVVAPTAASGENGQPSEMIDSNKLLISMIECSIANLQNLKNQIR